ncbi:trans-aconitate 2-methyltransferase [Kineothrix alysoides]|uniref:Trans-aconitate 2-methyltransferase n=1 Tax=Kineothrix alysoides TaxID=1469948 RepID=A0A4R1QW32_9FIRM|nr:methyltransferase domain-containing protein [Kineothrix alysoides]TCL56905.1 trans-aconitate 2-methyltransferase [Kineothrix alysoides]
MWNADVYNQYGKERMQPSIDLANRMNDKNFKRILDVGCGTGMSTVSLLSIWKDAEIVGVDLSEEMLQKAREYMPSISFVQRDCGKPLSDMETFDLIFSNAFLQWIPNQEEFILNSFDMLNREGVFAAQIPLFEEMPANQCIINAESILPDKFGDMDNSKYVIYSAAEYYDILSKATSKISIWITDYFHEMDNHQKILDFLKGAALRPYIDRLKEDEQKIFMKEVLKNIEREYTCQKNGKILFPFKRLFMIGEK